MLNIFKKTTKKKILKFYIFFFMKNIVIEENLINYNSFNQKKLNIDY